MGKVMTEGQGKGPFQHRKNRLRLIMKQFLVHITL